MESLKLDENYVINLLPNSEINEDYFANIIRQSEYLTLLKDKTLFHLRLDIAVHPSKLLKDKQLANYLIHEYPTLFDEKATYERTGDMNRFIVAKGKLTNPDFIR